jgi:tetratricopeptide (TPR) repeat protein
MAKIKGTLKTAEKVTAISQTGSSPQQATATQKTNGLLSFVEQLNPSRVIMLLCLVSCLAYANSLGGDFVFDDTDQIVENKDIRAWGNLGRAFTTHAWAWREKPDALSTQVPPSYYRPLVIVLFTIEYKLFGLWAQGWHIVNLLLHILCSIGVYYVLLLLADKKYIAVIASLLFAVHPIHVESVSWISGVTDPLFAVFFLSSFYFYLKYRRDNKRSQLIWSLLMFALSALSKETGLSLILLIFCVELIRAGKENGPVLSKSSSTLVAKIMKAGLVVSPYFGVAMLSLILRYRVLGGMTWDNPAAYHGPFIHTLFTLPWVICSYFLHLLWPVNLSITYHTGFETSATAARFILPLLALSVVAILLFVYRKKIGQEVWYALALLMIPLLPVMGLRNLSTNYLIVDRYLYLSTAGWAFFIVLALAKFADWEKRRALTQPGEVSSLRRIGLTSAVAVLLILLMTVGTMRENRNWVSAEALWAQAARVRPGFWAPHYNLGLALFDAKRYAEARDALAKAAILAPNEPAIFNSLGQTYTMMGEPSQAIENFRRSIEIDPGMFEAINNLGTIYFNSGDYKSAERYFKSALALRPRATAFHYNLGLCYSRLGSYSQAVPELEGALEFAPNDSAILYELGLAYERLGRRSDAIKALQQALSFSKATEQSDSIAESLKQITGKGD